jgi:hypothetical protein
MANVSHRSIGGGDAVTGHAGKNVATDGAAKKVYDVAVHPGMTRKTQSGVLATGGDAATYLDALTGNVVGGAVKSAPGWGSSGIQSGHPLAKAPGSKTLTEVAPAFGMKNKDGDHRPGQIAALGEAILKEAFASSCRDDRVAHGRNENHKPTNPKLVS